MIFGIFKDLPGEDQSGQSEYGDQHSQSCGKCVDYEIDAESDASAVRPPIPKPVHLWLRPGPAQNSCSHPQVSCGSCYGEKVASTASDAFAGES